MDNPGIMGVKLKISGTVGDSGILFDNWRIWRPVPRAFKVVAAETCEYGFLAQYDEI